MFYQIWIIYLTLKLIIIFKVFYLFFNFHVINVMELLQQTAMWVRFFIFFSLQGNKVIGKYGSNTLSLFLYYNIYFYWHDYIYKV